MTDELQLPAKIIKEGEVLRPVSSFVIQITADATRFISLVEKFEAERRERARTNPLVRPMIPWESRDADITL